MSGSHVVIQVIRGVKYEVWAPCDDRGCDVYHSKVATCDSKSDAEMIARKLDVKS